MRQDDQHEIWNPFCEHIDTLSATERADMERGGAWAHYINGGGGDPHYFDHMTWLKMQERSHER